MHYNVHQTTADYGEQKKPKGKYSPQKTAFSPKNPGVSPERIFRTPRFPEENGMRAGGKNSEKPRKRGCDEKVNCEE
jgi:hypothetical protein